MFSETKSRETSGLSGSDIKCILYGFMRVMAFLNIVRTHCVLNWNSLIRRPGLMSFHEMCPRTNYSGLKIKKKVKSHFYNQLIGVSSSIGDQRILPLLHVILWLNFN